MAISAPSSTRSRVLNLLREHGSSRAGFFPSSKSPVDHHGYIARTGYLDTSRCVRSLVVITLVTAVSAAQTMTFSTTMERTLKSPSAKTTVPQIARAVSLAPVALVETSELAPLLSLSHLENQVVRNETRREYRRRLVEFIELWFRLRVDWQNVKESDQLLVLRLDVRFFKG